MRDLKFRVWNGTEMVYDVTVGEFGAFYVNPGDKGNGLDPNDSASLTPFTTKYSDTAPVMQSTGLKDRTGKEIYEGDLLRWAGDDEQNFTAFEVFFHDGNSNAAYDIGYSISRTHHQGNVAGGYIPPLKPKTTKQMIVIGNIFEHKHLLK